jgi:hypothetical protein
VQISIPPESLRPLVEQCVGEAVARLEQVKATLPAKRLAYSEAEAAELLGLNRWQLRDLRRRGEITASRMVGNRYAYEHETLVAFLKSRRLAPSGE